MTKYLHCFKDSSDVINLWLKTDSETWQKIAALVFIKEDYLRNKPKKDSIDISILLKLIKDTNSIVKLLAINICLTYDFETFSPCKLIQYYQGEQISFGDINEQYYALIIKKICNHGLNEKLQDLLVAIIEKIKDFSPCYKNLYQLFKKTNSTLKSKIAVSLCKSDSITFDMIRENLEIYDLINKTDLTYLIFAKKIKAQQSFDQVMVKEIITLRPPDAKVSFVNSICSAIASYEKTLPCEIFEWLFIWMENGYVLSHPSHFFIDEHPQAFNCLEQVVVLKENCESVPKIIKKHVKSSLQESLKKHLHHRLVILSSNFLNQEEKPSWLKSDNDDIKKHPLFGYLEIAAIEGLLQGQIEKTHIKPFFELMHSPFYFADTIIDEIKKMSYEKYLFEALLKHTSFNFDVEFDMDQYGEDKISILKVWLSRDANNLIPFLIDFSLNESNMDLMVYLLQDFKLDNYLSNLFEKIDFATWPSYLVSLLFTSTLPGKLLKYGIQARNEKAIRCFLVMAYKKRFYLTLDRNILHGPSIEEALNADEIKVLKEFLFLSEYKVEDNVASKTSQHNASSAIKDKQSISQKVLKTSKRHF